MSGSWRPAARRREKVFGDGRSVPLDRNAKARIWAYALGYTASRRRRGQHRGPLTRAYLDVLRALLWRFHNQHSGRCFPAYEAIADAADVSRATVARAILALEVAGVLTWQNRLIRLRLAQQGPTGLLVRLVPQRTSNAYELLDSKPGDAPEPKSQKPTGTRNQCFLNLAGASIAEQPARPNSSPQAVRAAQNMLAAVRDRRTAAIWAAKG